MASIDVGASGVPVAGVSGACLTSTNVDSTGAPSAISGSRSENSLGSASVLKPGTVASERELPRRPEEANVAIKRTRVNATVGVAEHGNSAELVTIASDGELLDRRRIDLTRGLPTHPYHHEGSWAVGRYINSSWARPISLTDAVALVARVREAAASGAREGLEALAAAVPVPIASVAIRLCPKLPPTTEERIADTRAANVADSVMYRQALASAAEARGWSVHWYDRRRVLRDAAVALGATDIDAVLSAMGRAIGPPWQAKHQLAAAAALAARAHAVPRRSTTRRT